MVYDGPGVSAAVAGALPAKVVEDRGSFVGGGDESEHIEGSAVIKQLYLLATYLTFPQSSDGISLYKTIIIKVTNTYCCGEHVIVQVES